MTANPLADADHFTRDYMIINALGVLDNPNAPHSSATAGKLVQTGEDVTIDARTLAEAHASGLTAVNITLGYVMGDMDPYEHTLHDITVWDTILRDNAADVVKVRTAADLHQAQRDGRIGVIYGFQNAVALGDDVTRVDTFDRLGVRVVQLTYNQANALGDGSMEPRNRGLTPFGREVIQRLNDRHLMVDLSHSGEQTCLEAARISRQPVSINHTGCRALTDLPRNKTDEELRLVASRGGFVGIYFMPFLTSSGHARATDVVEHIDHAVNVCGEDHVGIGTDGPVTAIDDLDAYRADLAEQVARRREAGASATGEGDDVYPFVVDLRGVDQFRELIRLLEKRGYRSDRIEKILGKNFADYAERVWTS
ncbi:dipeptidase [Streptomyces olivochromogenes]|uniref:Peptidase M19 n=1 Tax=Streptomyces olivochromogenes TaxID=1963 RepID=A0A250VT91_STROL|nr:membrane dipeptidase [Streptomyces olivochromogenes]GAX57458.1 peptidase M19 [Streptomyces olivochromogenes]